MSKTKYKFWFLKKDTTGLPSPLDLRQVKSLFICLKQNDKEVTSVMIKVLQKDLEVLGSSFKEIAQETSG